jgi:hypothetical protein
MKTIVFFPERMHACMYTYYKHTHFHTFAYTLQMGAWIEDYPGQLEQIQKGEPTRRIMPPPEHTYLSDRSVCIYACAYVCV